MAGGFSGGGNGAIIFIVFVPIAILAATIGLCFAIRRSVENNPRGKHAFRAFRIGFIWATGLGATLSLVAAPLFGVLGWNADWIEAYLTVAAIIVVGGFLVGSLASVIVVLREVDVTTCRTRRCT